MRIIAEALILNQPNSMTIVDQVLKELTLSGELPEELLTLMSAHDENAIQ